MLKLDKKELIEILNNQSNEIGSLKDLKGGYNSLMVDNVEMDDFYTVSYFKDYFQSSELEEISIYKATIGYHGYMCISDSDDEGEILANLLEIIEGESVNNYTDDDLIYTDCYNYNGNGEIIYHGGILNICKVL